MLRIEIAPLGAGIHAFELSPQAEALELDPEKFGDLQVNVRLDVQEKRILAMLEATATAELVCDRTLRPFEQEIGGSYSLLFAPPEFAQETDAYDEVRVLHPGDREIDLTEAVRDTVLLAVPARCVAPGAEEEEIPTSFGESEDEETGAVDPRWEALRKLRAEGKGETEL